MRIRYSYTRGVCGTSWYVFFQRVNMTRQDGKGDGLKGPSGSCHTAYSFTGVCTIIDSLYTYSIEVAKIIHTASQTPCMLNRVSKAQPCSGLKKRSTAGQGTVVVAIYMGPCLLSK